MNILYQAGSKINSILQPSQINLLTRHSLKTLTSSFINPARSTSSLFTLKKSILFNKENQSVQQETFTRSFYSFKLTNRLHRNKRTTRPKKTTDHSLPLNYEQAQFAEKLGVTKSWNTWNTSNLLEGKRQAEVAYEDFFIRKFLFGTFHGLLASEFIIKRRFNTVNISFLIKPNKGFLPQKAYFLVGYSEELLSALLKCVVKIQLNTIKSTQDVVFKMW